MQRRAVILVSLLSVILIAFELSFGDVDPSTIMVAGAFYDQNTVWPDGFDPQAAGALLLGTGPQETGAEGAGTPSDEDPSEDPSAETESP
jgi:hypothetical protein